MKNVKEILAGKKGKMNVTHSDANDHRHYHGHNGNTLKGTLYQCPMRCEGDKTYKEPGNCPVCNMHLAPIK